MGLPRERFTRARRRLSKPYWTKLLGEALGILFLHIWIMCEIISNFKNIFTPSSVLGVRTVSWCQLVNSGRVCGRDTRSWERWLQLLSCEGLCCSNRLVTWTAEGLNQINMALRSPWLSGAVTPSRLFDVWETQSALLKHGGSDYIFGSGWEWTVFL